MILIFISVNDLKSIHTVVHGIRNKIKTEFILPSASKKNNFGLGNNLKANTLLNYSSDLEIQNYFPTVSFFSCFLIKFQSLRAKPKMIKHKIF